MTISLQTFAAAKELLGSPIKLDVPEGATVSNLRSLLLQSYPELDKLADFAIARNETYALPGDPVNETDVFVIIPPVAGG